MRALFRLAMSLCGAGERPMSGLWTLTDTAAFTTDVRTDDGATHAFFRRERPHLLFEGKRGSTIALPGARTSLSPEELHELEEVVAAAVSHRLTSFQSLCFAPCAAGREATCHRPTDRRIMHVV